MGNEKNNKLTLMAAIAVFVLQLFVLVPITLYFNNIDEMGIGLTDLLKLGLIPALLLFLLMFLSGYLFSAGVRQRFVVLVAAASLLVWLQGNVLLWDYGLLDGRLIDWSKDTWRGWVDLAIWIIIPVVALLVSRRHGRMVWHAALAVFVLQFVTVGVMVLQHRKSVMSDASVKGQELDKLYQFSSNKNVLHLMVDGFQSDVFNDLIHVPQLGEYYRKAFKGFTYYPETLGVFPYTRFSVPAFLGGKIYSNEMPQDDFVDQVLSGDNVINQAYEKGYEVDLAMGSPYLEKRYTHLSHTHLYNLDSLISSHLQDVAQILDIALFRVAPHFIKPYIYNEQKWLLSSFFADGKGMQFNYFRHTYFLANLINNMSAARTTPVYKYFHVMNTHNPMVVNANCNYDGKVSPMTRETLTIQTKCTLDTVAALLYKMQAMGIYDNTLIVIHGDHGGWTGNHRNGMPVRFINDAIGPDSIKSLASPMLAIKLPGHAGAMQVSDKLVSLADLPDTISDAMSLGRQFGHRSILALPEGENRQRYFRYYAWKKDTFHEKYAAPIQEFVINGSHYDTEWLPGEVYYPPEK